MKQPYERKTKWKDAWTLAFSLFSEGHNGIDTTTLLENQGFKVPYSTVRVWYQKFKKTPEYLAAKIKKDKKGFQDKYEVAPEAGMKEFLQLVINSGFRKLKTGDASVTEALKATELKIRLEQGGSLSTEESQQQIKDLFKT